jgi:Flp pilus assembly protein TadD
MGLAYGALCRREFSCEHYNQAAQLVPGESVYAANCGYALIQLGRAGGAIPHLRRAIASAPRDGYAFVLLGDALRQMGNEEEAIRAYREAKGRFETFLRSEPHDRQEPHVASPPSVSCLVALGY